MSCTDTVKVCIIRGDMFEQTIALAGDWTEVIDSPASYLGKLVLRYDQDDSLSALLTLTAIPEEPDVGLEATLYPSAELAMQFSATPSQTAALPQWDVVGYVELTKPGDATYVKRLVNLDVEVSD